MRQSDLPVPHPAVGLLPDAIPVQREAEGRAGSAGDSGWIAIVAVLALLMLAVAVFQLARRRRRSAQPTGGGACCVSSTRLTPRHSLHVVTWQGRQLLVGCGEDVIELLAEAPLEAPIEGPVKAHEAAS